MTAFESAWLVLKAPFVYEPNPSEGSWKGEFDTGEIDYLFRGQKVGDDQGRYWTPNIKEALFYSIYGDQTGREGVPELLIARARDKNVPLMRDPSYVANLKDVPAALVNLQGGFDDVQTLQGWDIHEFLTRSPGMKQIRRAYPEMFEQPEGYVPRDDLPDFASVEHPYFEEVRRRKEDRLDRAPRLMDRYNMGYGRDLARLTQFLRHGYGGEYGLERFSPDVYDGGYEGPLEWNERIMDELTFLAENAGVPAPTSTIAR